MGAGSSVHYLKRRQDAKNARKLAKKQEKRKKKDELLKYLRENTDYQDKVRFLFQVPLLKRLPLDQQPLVARAAKSVRFPPRTDIFKEGEVGDEFFVLRQGEASVKIKTVNGGEKVVGRLGPGDYFGEKALLASEPRTATITTETFAECLKIHQEQFEELGLKDKLTFADRKARRAVKSRKIHKPTPKTPQDEEFIRECLLNNETLNGGMSNLTSQKVQSLINAMWRERIVPGRRLIREGDLGASNFYIIESGTFEVIISEKLADSKPGGIVHSKKTIVDVLRKGNTFGELALLFLIPRRATIVCTSEANVWVVDRHQFKAIVMPTSEEKQQEYMKIFNSVPLLMPLLTSEKAEMAKVVVEVTFHAEESIVLQGAPGNTFFILIEGKVAIIKDDLVKVELEANPVKMTMPYFGERALLYQEPRAATVKVLSESARCLMLDKEAFDEHMGLLKEVLENALKTLSSTEEKKKAHHPGDPDRDKIFRSELLVCGRIGCGGYSVVDLVQHAESGDTYALKSISKGYVLKADMKPALANEKDVLYMTSSPFITKLYETYNTPTSLCFLLEAALGGELFTTYRKQSFFGSDEHARYYIASAAFALEHLHDRKIIYRDLKPENMLLDHNGLVKLSDMGSAKFATNSTYTVVGTPDYFAPEMVKACGHDCSVDWWSVGVLLFELMAGKPPFESAYPFQTFAKIEKGIDRVRFPALLIGPCEDVIKALMRDNPDKRLPAQRGGLNNLWKQPFFTGFEHAAMRNQTLAPPFNPHVRSNRDLANFFSSPDDHPRELPYEDPGDGWDEFFASC